MELQDEITQSRTREEHYRKYIRELEQKNDDLERAQRYSHSYPSKKLLTLVFRGWSKMIFVED